MATSKVYQIVPKLPLIVLLIYSIAWLPSISGRGKEMRMVLGSSPPKCVGRCMGCRPCVAALVIPPHKWWWFRRASSSSTGPGDENYYLLSWKCRCRNKFYQP
ncbi:unnamed protein product [Cuscuta epithymum]|uniref:Epidermal patterning factor-like protein n=1 Tax=Cuscuta epithymum TaxID=186058 RepID=A0AAV0CZY6_9ASTE|nr:unnamed protein product [Cuscuta epithymum]CAH9125005.1 unnamed protein product [Cuscuta epithymum]